MIDYVVYSHTDYLDVLSVQTSCLEDCKDKILLINRSELELSSLYSQYKDVVLYDDKLPYASRLLALSDLDLKYVLFIHDIDAVIQKDDATIDHLVKIMDEQDIDRIDLQYQTPDKNPHSHKINLDEFNLTKQDDPSYYIYNVNPSIWKLSTLLDIMRVFADRNYRNIETLPTQNYAAMFKVYKLYSEDFLRCGYFECLPFFQFIHLTHGGQFLPLKDNNLENHLQESYTQIVSDFLGNSTKPFRPDGRLH
tara:strand:+ start:11155 stop:11907 length:753 start_codon:yes stop_codon:yes gene_type:complete